MNDVKQDEYNLITDHLHMSARVKQQTAEACSTSIIQAAHIISETFRKGNKILLCGNGGSAADCQHLASEFVNRLSRDMERRALPALALTTDTSFLTSFANDYCYEAIFSRQVQAFGIPGDTLIGISTSGNSSNVILAIQSAQAQNLHTIALIGSSGRLATLADVVIAVPSQNTQYIQEAHLAIEHILCELVERQLFSP